MPTQVPDHTRPVIREVVFIRSSVNNRFKLVPLEFIFGVHSDVISPLEEAFMLAFLTVHIYVSYAKRVKSVGVMIGYSCDTDAVLSIVNKTAFLMGRLPKGASCTAPEFIEAFKGLMDLVGLHCEDASGIPEANLFDYYFVITDPSKCLNEDTAHWKSLDPDSLKNVSCYLC